MHTPTLATILLPLLISSILASPIPQGQDGGSSLATAPTPISQDTQDSTSNLVARQGWGYGSSKNQGENLKKEFAGANPNEIQVAKRSDGDISTSTSTAEDAEDSMSKLVVRQDLDPNSYQDELEWEQGQEKAFEEGKDNNCIAPHCPHNKMVKRTDVDIDVPASTSISQDTQDNTSKLVARQEYDPNEAAEQKEWLQGQEEAFEKGEDNNCIEPNCPHEMMTKRSNIDRNTSTQPSEDAPTLDARQEMQGNEKRGLFHWLEEKLGSAAAAQCQPSVFGDNGCTNA